MRMFIPTIGTKLRLTDEWRCTLKQESRNWLTIDLLTPGEETAADRYNAAWDMDWRGAYQLPEAERMALLAASQRRTDAFNEAQFDLVLPVDTVLSIDRIFIRKHLDQFDSITFQIEDCPEERFRSKKMGGTAKRKPRFWVKLDEANTIEFDLVE